MACLAWLLFVLVPVHAEPAAGMSDMRSGTLNLPMTNLLMAGAPTTALAEHVTRITGSILGDDCCGGLNHHWPATGCHCAASSSAALASVPTMQLLPWLPDRAGGGRSRCSIMAPGAADPPPLRPPVV